MQLKSIRASGFKSFADPTHIPIKSHLTAIVGPNGCGKSNVVDAIKWVIGEISAKQLRGQTMTDIIFNGTTTRQPVGQAMVELHFDNSDGRIGGQYAGYSEITVRREVTRDGQSNYYLNGTLCRRRDILDVFLGTGLGSRSYSIIEQGMISQMIEAKPEVLRAHLEEVAQTSQYKERRKETQTRMRHTQENLDRLNDILEELEKQLRHLKRQSEAASKYNIYKTEEKTLRAQIQALHWQELENKRGTQQARLDEQNTAIEKRRASQRELETGIEKIRLELQATNDEQNGIQKTYYECGSEIARTEQEIQHNEQQRKRWQQELESITSTQQELQELISEHQQQIDELTQELEELNPEDNDLAEKLDQAKQALQQAEARMKTWQSQWDQWQAQHSELKSRNDVARTKIEHCEQKITDSQAQQQRLQAELAAISLDALTQELDPVKQRNDEVIARLQTAQQNLEELREKITAQRQEKVNAQNQVQAARNKLQELKKQEATLEALQEAALGNKDKSANEWLERKSLLKQTRLGQTVQVEKGWEQAVETVLGRYFDAVCVEDINNLLNDLTQLPEGSLTLVEARSADSKANSRFVSLAQKVNSAWPLQTWLHDIYVADDLNQASEIRKQLQAHESVITRDGLWLGASFVHVNKKANPENSILWRKQKLAETNQLVEAQQQAFAEAEQNLRNAEAQLSSLEAERDSLHSQYQRLANEVSEAKSELTAKQTRLTDAVRRREQLQKNLGEAQEQQTSTAQLLQELQEQRQGFAEQLSTLEGQQQRLQAERETVQNNLVQARAHAQRLQQQHDELEIRVAANESQLALLNQTVARDDKRLKAIELRQEELNENLNQQDDPLVKLKEALAIKLEQHLAIRDSLQVVEAKLAQQAEQAQELELERNLVMQQLTQLQSDLEAIRMEHQTISVRQATIIEQLQEHNLSLDEAKQGLAEDAELKLWQENLAELEKRIERLGPINLAAIEEYAQADERKTYLDKQHADLTEALSVLSSAIDKIDRETKNKFKETFDQVNQGFQEIFPKVFGGGRAHLELETDDLLTAGILVKAQPPGKKNSSIHMLSGGEKALTAISLVFAMFRLNPAPFCVLDEVDAPLDDLNVGRFCSLVKEMAKETQFIVISHNKVTIEMADHMMGVTMQEPGVSRIVSVDVHEAMKMVEA